VSVALIIQHAMHMCHIVVCGLSSPSSFFHIISQASWFKKQHFWTKMCVSIFSTNVWSIFHSKKNWQRYDQTNILVCMNSASCCFDIVMEIEFTWQFFLKNPHIFYETPSSGSRIVPCRWTDMMNVLVAFQYFANVPNVENLGWYDMIYIFC